MTTVSEFKSVQKEYPMCHCNPLKDLVFRNIDIKLKLAYLISAYVESKFNVYFDGYEVEDNDKRYTLMWDVIDGVYGKHFYMLSDREISDLFQRAFRTGYTIGEHKIKADLVQKAQFTWNRAGWYRHELRRDHDTRIIKNVAKVGFVLAFVAL